MTTWEYPACHPESAHSIMGIVRPAAPTRGPYRARVRRVRSTIAVSPVRCAMVRAFNAATELAAGSAPS